MIQRADGIVSDLFGASWTAWRSSLKEKFLAVAACYPVVRVFQISWCRSVVVDNEDNLHLLAEDQQLMQLMVDANVAASPSRQPPKSTIFWNSNAAPSWLSGTGRSVRLLCARVPASAHPR